MILQVGLPSDVDGSAHLRAIMFAYCQLGTRGVCYFMRCRQQVLGTISGPPAEIPFPADQTIAPAAPFDLWPTSKASNVESSISTSAILILQLRHGIRCVPACSFYILELTLHGQ